MHYAKLKRKKSQQKELPEHVAHTNEFQLFSQLKCKYRIALQRHYAQTLIT